MKRVILFALMLCALQSTGQTYTFECSSGARLSGDSCDICPNTIVNSRSFNGLIIYRDSQFYRWVDQPYSIRTKPGDIVEYWEHGANPYSERVTIPLSLTPFFTVQGMADSTWCNFTAPGRYPLLYLDSISPGLYAAELSGFPSGFGIRQGLNTTLSRDNDTLVISSTGGGSALPANNGVSDNEGGGVYRLGNRYMASPDAPFTMDRNVNIDGRALFIGDLSDSILFHVDGITDRIGIGTATPQKKLHVQGQARISNLINDTPDRVLGADSDGDVSRLFLSGLTVSSGVLRAVDSSATNEIQQANSGLSDNELSIIRLGNRYMNGSDGLFSTDRKVNVNALKFYIGDNTDSSLVVVDGTNDRVGISTSSPAQKLEVNAAANAYIQATTSGGLSNAGSIFYNSSDGNQSWAVYRQNDGDFAVGVSSDNLYPAGTLTDPFIIKPSPPNNSFYMDSAGKIQLGGTSPQRTLHVTGEVRITDLVTTTATVLVGADASGDLSSLGVGSGLAISGGNLTSTAGTFYQTFRGGGAGFAQQAAANFTSSATVTATLTNDAGSGETEVRMDVPANGITITQMADNSVGTAELVASSVTYAKIQNAAANNVLLGNNNGAGTAYEELNAAAAQTILGYVDATPAGVNQGIAYFTDGNTITAEAAFIYDAANDRQTINCTTPSFGAGAAIVNIANVGTDGTGEFLRMQGAINGNMLAGMYNSSTTATSNIIVSLSQAGDAAGDACLQFQVSGAGGITHAVGVDNSDNRFKITPNANLPGATAAMGVIVRDNAGVGNTGINNDFPIYPLTVEGRTRSDLFMGEGNLYTAANITFGAGAGTLPVLGNITGTGNAVRLKFQTGTTPTADANIFTITYPNAFITESVVSFSAGGDTAGNGGKNAAADITKFYCVNTSATTFIIKANGTLTASQDYELSFSFFGY